MGQERRRARVEPLRVSSNGKRFFSEAYKQSVVEECLRPGASVSGVALAHGFNANLVRNWIAKHQRRGALVPVTVVETTSGAGCTRPDVAQTVRAEGCIEIELGGARVWVRGRVEAAQLRLVLEVLGAYR
jgi:transposase